MQLKEYQQRTLDFLRRFFEESRIAGPQAAYERITGEPELARRLGRYGGTYHSLAELPGVPYVCLRLPTGGGKTVLAAHAVGIARVTWIEKDYPVVLWLVPTNTIRQQTVEALKAIRHPYRQALNEAFGGRVRVFDIGEFTQIRPQDIRENCCVVVGTIQTLRVSNTEGRKVYAHHEDMEAHFAGLPKRIEGLEALGNGEVKYSFANVLHLARPLMIVDEAHNAVTGLTREMQSRVNPAAIIEFTATPREKSNILYSVGAQELKSEEMIKLPIRLSEHETWQNAVNGAIAERARLEEIAQGDRDYIRPIVLFQAQPKNQEVTVEVLKEYLMDVEGVAENKIAVATGNQRELDGIDLFDRKCPIEYVITIEALKEGWDCSFAYVFCSVSRIQSATNVEQLLGRVLRMPYARRRKEDALNRAYAFLSEPTFTAAAKGLIDKLIAMGFDEDEAEENVEHYRPFPFDGEDGDDDGLEGLFAQSEPFSFAVRRSSDVAESLVGIQGVLIKELENGETEITIAGTLSDDIRETIAAALPEEEREGYVLAAKQYQRRVEESRSPASRGERFEVPRLMTEIQGELAFADVDVLMEYHEWSILKHPARLTDTEFSIRETGHGFEIDLDGAKLVYRHIGEWEERPLPFGIDGWTHEKLVVWLDRQVRQPDIHPRQLLRWLSDLIGYLTAERGIDISALMRCKFILARRISDKIEAIRLEERDNLSQKHLFGPEAQVSVSQECAFVFRDGMYRGSRRYDGRGWTPTKHFLGNKSVPAFDGAQDGEEKRCAEAIDSLPQVKFWIRNVSRHPNSFSLPTATDKFYPDFVAKLNDDRLLVVEYKGAHIADGKDTAEKRAIGEKWERAGAGRHLFLVVEKTRDGQDMRVQLLAKIGESGG